MGNVAKNQTDLTFVLAAGQTIRRARVSRSYHCMAVTTDGVVQIGLGYEPGEFLYTGVGEKLHPSEPDFTEITLYNSGGTAQTVVLKTSLGDVVDNRFTLPGGTLPVSIAVPPVVPNTVDSDVDVSIAATSNLDFALDAARRGVFISNTDPSNTVRFRDQSAATTEGVPIPPNTTLYVETSGAFRIRNPNASAVSVAVCFLKWI